jgi:hypothetical protein
LRCAGRRPGTGCQPRLGSRNAESLFELCNLCDACADDISHQAIPLRIVSTCSRFNKMSTFNPHAPDDALICGARTAIQLT